MKASAAAVKSIIGEVFSDVSFEEFERGSSTVSFSEKQFNRCCFYFFSPIISQGLVYPVVD